MADTYGVTPADVAAELPPTLFPSGFTQVTRPTLALVTSFITDADLEVSIAVENAAGAAPSVSDRAARLARRAVIEKVKAQVLRIVYGAQAPADVAAATRPYDDLAKSALLSVTTLQTQAIGEGDPVARILTSDTTPTRDLVVCDDQLDLSASRGRF